MINENSLIYLQQPQLMHNISDHDIDQQNTFKPYGNYIPLCHSNNQPVFLLGPHYFVFIPTLIGLSFLFVFLFVKTMDVLTDTWKIVISIFIVIFVISYILIGVSNPGIIKKQQSAQSIRQQNFKQSTNNYCRFCNINKPDRAKHCKECDVCIEGYDHHCVWIGKCVGSNNLGRFYAFVFSLFFTFVLFFIATLMSSTTSGPRT